MSSTKRTRTLLRATVVFTTAAVASALGTVAVHADPPVVNGKVKTDGSRPPTGKFYVSGPGYVDHPTVFGVSPGTFQWEHPLGIKAVPATADVSFSGTAFEATQPILFDVFAVVPGKRTQFGNPSGIYQVYPYFAREARLTCGSGSCSPDLNETFYAKWGNVVGTVKLTDDTPIPWPLIVTARPTSIPDPNRSRWKLYFASTNGLNGAYSFHSSFIYSENPLNDQCTNPFNLECHAIPVDPANNWGLPVLGDGGLEGRDRHDYSNGEATFGWEISLSAKQKQTALVKSSKATPINFRLSLWEFFSTWVEQVENRHGECDDPEGNCERCGPPSSAPYPVSLITGNVFLDHEDARLRGLRHDVVFERSYNSFDTSQGVLGMGWTHTFEKRIEPLSDRLVRLWSGTGAVSYFSDPEEDGVLRPYGSTEGSSRIVRSGDGWRRTFRTGGYEDYDSGGRLTRRADRVGRAITLSHDTSGRVTRILSPEGRALTLEYGGGTLRRVRGPEGIIAEYSHEFVEDAMELRRVRYIDGTGYRFTYDDGHRLLKVIDLAGVVLESHGYEGERAAWSERSNGRERRSFSYEEGRTLVTDARGTVSTFEWVEKTAGRFVTKVTGCDFCGSSGGTRVWNLDDEGRILSYLDADENPTTYTWQGSNLASVTNALGQTTSYADHDEFGRARSVIVFGRGTTYLTYAPEGVTSITLPTGQSTIFTYENQRLRSVRSGAGATRTLVINDLGEVTSITDARGKTATLTHDSMGRLLSAMTPDGQITRFERVSGGRLRAIVRPDGKRIELTHDTSGRVSKLTDEAGRAHSRTFDAFDRIEASVDPLGAASRLEYDVMSSPTALVDALGRRTTFEYDTFGRLKGMADPNGGSETYEHYPSGRVRVHMDRRGIRKTFAYDGVGRLTSVQYSDGTPTLTIGHNDATRTVTLANGVDTLTLVFDAAGRLESETSALNGTTVSSTYTDDHLRQSLRLNGDLIASYSYTAGYLDSITFGSRQLQFEYDDMGRHRRLTYPNGIETTHSYQPQLGWLERIQALAGGSTVLDVTYTHHDVGNRTSKTMGNLAEQYRYDAGSRLIGVARPNAPQRNWAFDYDLAGNRTRDETDGVPKSLSHDTRNRLFQTESRGPVRVTGQSTEPATVLVDGRPARMVSPTDFEADVLAQPGQNTMLVEARDGSGNVRTSTFGFTVATTSASYSHDPNGNLSAKVDTSGSWSYEWNANNQLTRALRNGGEVARFEYDPLGRRVRKTTGSRTTALVYDGSEILRESDSDGEYQYVHGPGIDEPLARSNSLGSMTYYHADGLGSIVATTNQAGAVVSTRQYDAWGSLEVGADESGYAFTGREWDAETGLYYYRARYYDPKLAQFIAEDPIGFSGGVNFYRYVRNSPVNFRDPLGLRDGRTGFNPAQAQANMERALGYLLNLTFVPAKLIDSWFPEHHRDNWFDRALDGVSPAEEEFLAVVGSLAGGPRCQLGAHKSAATWANQMLKRGWTMEMIDDAIRSGQKFEAVNMVNPGNSATRYVHPVTGQSVVVDNVTNTVLHVGGPGFRY